MKKIAIVTSGGDAPGLNAALRAVVRTAIDKGWAAFGVRLGYAGLASDDFLPLGLRDVGGIIQHGGRSLDFRQRQIDVLIVIGAHGSQAGALALLLKGLPQ